MRNSLIIGGICVALIALGAWLYVHAGPDVRTVGAPTTPAQATATLPAEKSVPFTILTSGTGATEVTARKNYAIYTSDELASFWKKAKGTTAGVPKIDFTKTYVIAVFAGEKPTGGYAISLSGITDAGAARDVSVLITEPGKGCVTTEAKTSPYMFVSVPLMNAPSLSHTDTTERKDCQ